MFKNIYIYIVEVSETFWAPAPGSPCFGQEGLGVARHSLKLLW